MVNHSHFQIVRSNGEIGIYSVYIYIQYMCVCAYFFTQRAAKPLLSDLGCILCSRLNIGVGISACHVWCERRLVF